MNDFDLAVENLYFGPVIVAFDADCDELVGVLRAGAPSTQPDFLGFALTSTAGVGETSEEAGSQWCGYSNSEC